VVRNARLPRAVCAVVGDVLRVRGSHDTLNALFKNSGAPGEPPQLSHPTKWKEWLFLCGTNPECDTLAVLGNVLEEFMDLEPSNPDLSMTWPEDRERVVRVLEENGFRYYRGGRVLPIGAPPEPAYPMYASPTATTVSENLRKPADVDELLLILLKNLRRAMHPLALRRRGAVPLSFATEYDVQDLLHALLRPWVADIRPEEFTPSYAGTSTRMDFLLPAHRAVIEMKFVRDADHAKKIGNELIEDIEHYRKHPDCGILWCVVYDPEHLIRNPEGLKKDLEGTRTSKDGAVEVKVLIL
jgi:REase_DpnII-MboI